MTVNRQLMKIMLVLQLLAWIWYRVRCSQRAAAMGTMPRPNKTTGPPLLARRQRGSGSVQGGRCTPPYQITGCVRLWGNRAVQGLETPRCVKALHCKWHCQQRQDSISSLFFVDSNGCPTEEFDPMPFVTTHSTGTPDCHRVFHILHMFLIITNWCLLVATITWIQHSGRPNVWQAKPSFSSSFPPNFRPTYIILLIILLPC